MLTLRQLTKTPFLRIHNLCRSYLSKEINLKTDGKMSAKQVHKEIMKYVNPFANIYIRSDILLKVHAADVHRYPNADVLVAELHGTHAKNCNVDLLIDVSEDEQNIDIQVAKLDGAGQDFHCELAVPVKAALNIQGNDGVVVEHMLGSEVTVIADGNIKTRDVRCVNITLKSANGNINCAGMLLGQKTILETTANGCILLDKVQGDDLNCKTVGGDIHTNCSYVEDAKFETDNGCMELKNVHKFATVNVNGQDGSLNMTGVHGNVQVQMNGRSMKLQLSELHGDSLIIADHVDKATVNISNDIETDTEINVMAETINLNHTLSHLQAHLTEQKQCFHHNPTKQLHDCRKKLTVRCSNGKIQLGKLSWAEMMCSPKSTNKTPVV